MKSKEEMTWPSRRVASLSNNASRDYDTLFLVRQARGGDQVSVGYRYSQNKDQYRLLCILILLCYTTITPSQSTTAAKGHTNKEGPRAKNRDRKPKSGVHGPLGRRSRAGHSLLTLTQDVLRPRHANETRSESRININRF